MILQVGYPQKVIGSVGELGSEGDFLPQVLFHQFISRWNKSLILTIDPNFLGHPSTSSLQKTTMAMEKSPFHYVLFCTDSIMGFISIFHHHLVGIFLRSFPTTEQSQKSKHFGYTPRKPNMEPENHPPWKGRNRPKLHSLSSMLHSFWGVISCLGWRLMMRMTHWLGMLIYIYIYIYIIHVYKPENDWTHHGYPWVVYAQTQQESIKSHSPCTLGGMNTYPCCYKVLHKASISRVITPLGTNHTPKNFLKVTLVFHS